MIYDLIIIGGGPAAISAGIYAARKKLKTLLITKDWGGQTAIAPWIENYPGFEKILGQDLTNKFVSQLKKNELEIKRGVEIKQISLKDSVVEIKANDKLYQSKAVIIATGRMPKKLGLANEDKFIGKGISYCATCDAPVFKDKAVAVVGGGNTGASIALELVNYASKVYILSYRPKLPAAEILQERIKKSPKISVITNVVVKELKGDKFIKGLVCQERTSQEKKQIALEGVFVAIGYKANSFLVKDMVELNEKGEIKINDRNQTSQPRIFAAGDVTDIFYKQIVIAAGEGAKAALNVYEKLNT